MWSRIRSRTDFGLISFGKLLIGSFLLLIGIITGVATPAHAESVDDAVAKFAQKIGKVLVNKGKTKLAVIDFTDIEGKPTEFGRFFAEQLSVEFVNTPGISVMDRANLKSILAEHKLSAEGFISPETTKRLGQFTGVDVLITGTITSLDDKLAVTAKAITTDTSEEIAACKVDVARTKENQQLLMRGVLTNKSSNTFSGTASTDLASKDFGDLRVTMHAVRPTKVEDAWHSSIDGIRCILEVTNRNTEWLAVVALNCNFINNMAFLDEERTKLTDNLGRDWLAYHEDNMPLVRVGGGSPLNITVAITRGVYLGSEHRGFEHPQELTWRGSFIRIPPGETIKTTIDYGPPPQERGRQTIADVSDVDFQCEIVVGFGPQGGPISQYEPTLYSWSWDGLKVGNR